MTVPQTTDTALERWTRPPARPAVVVAIGLVGFVAVIAWGLLVSLRADVTAWDQRLLVRINSGHSSALDTLAGWTNTLFSTAGGLVLIIALVVVIALVTRRLGDGLFAGLAVGVIYCVAYAIKIVVGRDRPAPLPYQVPGAELETSPSFPSGHVAIASALVVVLFLVVRGAAGRLLVGIVGALVIVWTAFSRMYLGAHYLDDVAASVVYVLATGPLIYAALLWIDTRVGAVLAVNRWAGRLLRRPAAPAALPPARRAAI